MKYRVLRLTRGDTERVKVRWLAGPDKNPVALASARFTVRETADSEDTLLVIEGDDVDLSEAGTAAVQFEASAAGVWDFELTSTAGRVETPFGGDLIVTRDISR